LTRTAVLERMCGPLCEAVLELPGSAAVLADLARSNLLLVPLDRRGLWYRYHHLFRDMLLAELERQEPGLVPVLRRRAAAWCLRNGLPEEAVEYAIAAGDVGTVGYLVAGLMLPAYRRGRVATLQRWLGWLDDRDAMRSSAMRSALGTSPRLMSSWWRCVNSRCWRWAAVTGAAPGTWPDRHAQCCARPSWKTATSRPWSARCKPVTPGTAGTSQRRGSC
jgi:LuxR family transcriptional regulator, maltose regulon positive regulatory protein